MCSASAPPRRRIFPLPEHADEHEDRGLPPTRISFKSSLHLIGMFCTVNAWITPAATMKTEPRMLSESLSVLVLLERRPERRCKRQVKIKMSGYKRNLVRTASTDGDHKGNGVK